MYDNISDHLFQRQSVDQHGFTPDIRIEDASRRAEAAIEYHQSFKLSILILSMDMRKAVDIIDHPALVLVLRSGGLQEAYVSLLFF